MGWSGGVQGESAERPEETRKAAGGGTTLPHSPPPFPPLWDLGQRHAPPRAPGSSSAKAEMPSAGKGPNWWVSGSHAGKTPMPGSSGTQPWPTSLCCLDRGLRVRGWKLPPPRGVIPPTPRPGELGAGAHCPSEGLVGSTHSALPCPRGEPRGDEVRCQSEDRHVTSGPGSRK